MFDFAGAFWGSGGGGRANSRFAPSSTWLRAIAVTRNQMILVAGRVRAKGGVLPCAAVCVLWKPGPAGACEKGVVNLGP